MDEGRDRRTSARGSGGLASGGADADEAAAGEARTPSGSSGELGLLGAVLAGGESRRFGRDKTAEPVAGVPMIRRGVEALAPACREVVVVSSRSGTPTGPWRVVPDARPGRGPLAGIEAALLEARGLDWAPSAVVVLAADLPLVGSDAVARLLEAFGSAETEVDAVAARRDGDPDFEPLCAVYRVGCLETASELLDDGRAEARGLFEAVEGRTVAVEGDVASLNVNTEGDRVRAEERLAGKDRG